MVNRRKPSKAIAYMRVVAGQPGIHAWRVAELLGVSCRSGGVTLGYLRSRGWVSTNYPGNGTRGAHVWLTDAGRAILKEHPNE